MKRLASVIIIMFTVMIFALSGNHLIGISNNPASAAITTEENDDTTSTALVDMIADLIEKRGKNDSTIYLVGNVIFHHNGAIIQCDSAKKYSSNSMDFFGHVIINKDSAYIYGDKASYSGKDNMAEVFAPIIKMMRSQTSLYTYNLKFNTKKNIGYFSGGGFIIHKDTNHMESVKGEFNSDINEIKFFQNVQIHNPSYVAKSDSLKYNLDNEMITFLTHTMIWTKGGEILQASRGRVLTDRNICQFTKNSYILAQSSEIWADSMSYNTTTRQATLLNNVQIVDTEYHAIGFGNWALWDDSIKKAILTSSPSVRTYSSNKVDTLFMRADSIIMTSGDDTTNLQVEQPPMTVTVKKRAIPDSLQADSLLNERRDTLAIDSLINDINRQDSLQMISQEGETQKDTVTRLIKGFHDVRGWSKEYQFICDSMVGHSKDSMGTMYGKPVLWYAQNQIISEQIDFYIDNEERLDWADLTGDPILIQKINPINPTLLDSNRYNQAAGTSMKVYFTNNELDSSILQGNVHNLYWMDKGGFTAGFADITSANLTIFFKDRNLKRMRWDGNIKWEIHPIEKLPGNLPQYLAKFEWLDSIRPKTRKEISDRTIRASRRESVLSVSKPLHPIEIKMLRQMKEFKSRHIWEDRLDRTTVKASFFLTE